MTFEERLKISAEGAAEYIASKIPDVAGQEHGFSESFERTMGDFIANWGKRQRIINKHTVDSAEGNSKKHRVLRGVLIAAAVIIIVLGTVLAVSPEIRASLKGWIRDTFGIFITYENKGGITVSEDPGYELAWMPEGYELINHQKTKHGGVVNYLSISNKVLTFTYTYGDGATAVFIDPENAISETVFVNGFEAELLSSQSVDENSVIIWNDHENDTLFEISAFEDERTMIRMAESVIVK